LPKNNDPKDLASYINCLSMLENNAFLLYTALADKLNEPLVKSLLLTIASDSQKHSIVLKGVGESIAKSEGKPKDCEKKLGEAWHVIDAFYREIVKREKITECELPQLAEKLSVLESILGEEYYMFVQLKTLQLLMKEVSQIYNINLGELKGIFSSIINDEEHHRELLETIKGLLDRKKPKKKDNAPVVKYQNPDSWIMSLP
jgi:rubrerythrin